MTSRIFIYRHKATGGLYSVVEADATLESDGTRMIVYKRMSDSGNNAMMDKVWVRPFDEFMDGRFVLVGGVRL